MPDKVTSLDLKLAHEEWRKQMDKDRKALTVWADWFREHRGPEAWAEYAAAVTGGK